ncbi:MAG: monovalent cation/H+ antiporter complex subunit F [Thermodesulfobacteriota bacterium]
MAELHLWLALVLLATLVAGVVRILRGPTPADRMLAAQLMATTAVAVLLLLSKGLGVRALGDVALVFALLAALTAVALVRRGWPAPEGVSPPPGDRP